MRKEDFHRELRKKKSERVRGGGGRRRKYIKDREKINRKKIIYTKKK